MNREDVKAIKLRLMQAVLELDPESEDIVQALAELTGEIAAKLDQHVGRIPFEARMESFNDMARLAYQECRIGVKSGMVFSRLRP